MEGILILIFFIMIFGGAAWISDLYKEHNKTKIEIQRLKTEEAAELCRKAEAELEIIQARNA